MPPIRKSDAIHIEGNAKGQGRPKLTWVEIIKKDLLWHSLTDIMAIDRVAKQDPCSQPQVTGKKLS